MLRTNFEHSHTPKLKIALNYIYLILHAVLPFLVNVDFATVNGFDNKIRKTSLKRHTALAQFLHSNAEHFCISIGRHHTFSM